MRGILNTGITGGKITGYILGHMTLDRPVFDLSEYPLLGTRLNLYKGNNTITERYIRG